MSTDDEEELTTPYWRLGDPAEQRGLWQVLRRAPASIRPLVQIIVRSAGRPALATAIVQVGSGAASMIALLATSRLFGDLLANGPAAERMRHALPALLVVSAALMARGMLDTLVAVAQVRIGPTAVRLAQERLCEAGLRVELAALDDADFHDRLHRARDFGLPRLQQGAESLVSLVGALTSVVGAGAALGVLHPVLVPVLILGALPSGWAALKSAQLGHENMARTITLTRRMWMIAGLVTDRSAAAEIRANQAEPFVRDEYLDVADALREQAIRVGLRQTRVRAVGRTLAGLGLAATLALLALLTDVGWIPLAVAGTAVVAIRSATAALATLLTSLSQILEHGLYIDDYRDFLTVAAGRTRPSGGLPVTPPTEITIRRVGFRYPGAPDDQYALRDIDLTIHSGQTIALVGENGSGKTTLAKVIAGLYRPTSGTVCWDGTDIADLDPAEFASNVMVMLQEPVRWPHDVRTNVRIGRHDRDDPGDAALHDAAVRARAHDVVAGLPNGWDTLLSKYFRGGRELSGGQWQRIAVARGLFRDAPVLIWDEPTAPLDARSELAVYESLRGMARGRTVILITHRLASVRHADRICLLHDGELVESGDHETLMTLGGRYATACEMQDRLRTEPVGVGSRR